MNESLAEAIVMKWAHELDEKERPRLMPLANLSAIIARHLPDPEVSIIESLLPAKLRPIHKAIHASASGREPAVKESTTRGTCSWNGCTKPRFCKGLCSVHYNRKRQGKPMDAVIRRSPSQFRRGVKTRKAKATSKAAAKEDRHVPELQYDMPRQLQRWIPNEELTKEHRSKCPAYKRCQIMAKRYQWVRWTCSGCLGPRPEKSVVEELPRVTTLGGKA